MTRSKMTQEDKNIKYLETRYMYERRGTLYVANEEINQVWDDSDVWDFIAAWENNWTMPEIVEYLGSSEIELSLLAIDLIEQGRIEGSIQITKPKKAPPHPMEIMVDEKRIRIIEDKELWICTQDIWEFMGGKENSIFETGLKPGEKSIHVIDTIAGRQSFIFINMPGWSKLYKEVGKKERSILNKLKVGVKNRMESGRKTETRAPHEEKKRTGRIPAER